VSPLVFHCKWYPWAGHYVSPLVCHCKWYPWAGHYVSPLVFHCEHVCISYHFNIKQRRDLEIWITGRSRSLPSDSSHTSYHQSATLLLIYDAVHNAMTSQQYNTNSYCMVVLHACIHALILHSQPKPKIVRSATGSTEYGKPTLDLQVALSASSK